MLSSDLLRFIYKNRYSDNTIFQPLLSDREVSPEIYIQTILSNSYYPLNILGFNLRVLGKGISYNIRAVRKNESNTIEQKLSLNKNDLKGIA